MKENKFQHIITIITIVLFFTACGAFFLFYYPYHLHFKEQLTLFVMHTEHLASYLTKPAFAVEIVGDYLTQFYLLVGAGPAILTTALFLFWWGMQSAFKQYKIQHAGLLALIPTSIEWAFSCHIEYSLSMTIAAVCSVWLFVAYAKIRNRKIAKILAFPVTLCLYILTGGHFYIFVLLVMGYELKQNKHFIYAISLFILALLTPVAGSYCYLLTIPQSVFYPIIERYMIQNPFFFLITEGIILCILLLSRIRISQWGAIIAIYIITPLSIYIATDKKEESILGISSEAYFGRWERVLQMAETSPHQSYIHSYYANLANARKGELPDKLLEYYQPAFHGLLLEMKETIGYIYAMATPDALIECKDMAQAQHSAMLAMTFTPHQRSSRMARKLAEIAIINQEYDAARKYLWMLAQTSLHRNWAEKKLEQIQDIPETDPFLAKEDTLFFPNEWHHPLRNLLEANPFNKTAADYLLCYHLLKKDLAGFKEDYDRYYYPVFGSSPSVLYQQALLPCLDERQDPKQQLAYYRIRPDVYEQCVEFLSSHQQAGGNVQLMESKYAGTYWFYLYYAQIKQP